MFATFVAAALAAPPAPPPRETADPVRAAAARALPRLTAGADRHAEQKACFSCHNQAIPMLAVAAAAGRGFAAPDGFAARQAAHVADYLAGKQEKFESGDGVLGGVDTAGYALLTLELAGHKPDDAAAAVVEYLIAYPGKADNWRAVSYRPPTEASPFTPTYLALRALRHWGTEKQKERIAARVTAARAWLLMSPAKDTEDRVFRLLGLKEAGADEVAIAAAAADLLKTQRADGGWGQLESMESDAYATGSALVALHDTGGLNPDAPAYRAGVAFLLKTQREDGTWRVSSRSLPLQPYYESGFPHGKNQFISIAATGWAATALLRACGPR